MFDRGKTQVVVMTVRYEKSGVTLADIRAANQRLLHYPHKIRLVQNRAGGAQKMQTRTLTLFKFQTTHPSKHPWAI